MKRSHTLTHVNMVGPYSILISLSLSLCAYTVVLVADHKGWHERSRYTGRKDQREPLAREIR